MKVLHVVAEMDPKLGGVCQAVRMMIDGLSGLHVHNEVVSLDAPEARFLQDDPFTTNALGPGKGPWNYSRALRPWLIENLPRFDCVIVHGLWLYHTYATRQAMRAVRNTALRHGNAASGPRVFVMPHGMLDPYFQRAAGRKLKAIRNWVYWKSIEQHVVQEADGLFFTCEDERLLAQTTFQPYRPQSEVVVGLGIKDPPAYTEAMQDEFLRHCPALRGQKYILFLSRIHEKKGVDLLLAAYAELVAGIRQKSTGNQHPEPGNEDFAAATSNFPRLVIAGPGLETPYGQLIEKIVRQDSWLQQLVAFPGMLTGSLKWGAFYNCDAFILPSHQENFGIAVVEAMACGKTVLISNQINIWREILAGGGGLVEDDTAQATKALLRNWVALSAEQKQAAELAALATYKSSFAIAPVAARLLAALQP